MIDETGAAELSPGRRKTRSAERRTWSVEDESNLRRLAEAGNSIEEIATALNRSRNAIKQRATLIGLSLGKIGSRRARLSRYG